MRHGAVLSARRHLVGYYFDQIQRKSVVFRATPARLASPLFGGEESNVLPHRPPVTASHDLPLGIPHASLVRAPIRGPELHAQARLGHVDLLARPPLDADGGMAHVRRVAAVLSLLDLHRRVALEPDPAADVDQPLDVLLERVIFPVVVKHRGGAGVREDVRVPLGQALRGEGPVL